MRFSVIIPSKNRPQFLRQAVDSALAQSHGVAEVLVVDDGVGASRTLAGMPASVRVLDNRQRGPVMARILGTRAASGEAIAFLDDDDQWTDPAYLAKAAAAFAQGADLCFGDGTMVFDNGRKPLPYSFAASAWSLERDNTILISAVSYRRTLHGSLGEFDEALPYYWDWDWYLRVARAGNRLHHLAEPVVAIRVHASNMSGQHLEAERRANLKALEAKHGLAPIPLKNHLSLVGDQPPERM